VIDFYKTTATEIANKVKTGEWQAVDVAKQYLDRINKTNPALNAFIHIHNDVLENAKKVDDKRKAGKQLGKLAGVPIAIKDNMCEKGKETTSCSKVLKGYKPPYNATVVEKLLDADAIPMGKTNMDEFAMGSSSETSIYGAVSNPYDKNRIPGGSSGGSAVSVAAGMTPIALGSDTGGSIRQPAALCGIMGIKPTNGRVSRYGLMAYSSSLDQIGPFARNTQDMALLLEVIAGHDPKDATSIDTPVPVYTNQKAKDLKGTKIGIPRAFMQDGIETDVKNAIEKNAIQKLKDIGAEIVDIELPHAKYGIAAYYLVATAEASSNLGRYDGIHYGYRSETVKDLASIYINSRSEGFGREVKRRILLGTFSLSAGYYDQFYNKATKVRRLILNDYLEAFKKVDAVLTPTSPFCAFKKGEKTSDPMQMYLSDIYTVCNNLSGLPGVSVNCGLSTLGLPIGVQLTGKSFGEENLFKIISAYESATNYHLTTPNL
jgi:aspartyl-tRNA(Asn)/glutamyl-tRNA(Gln) amidotransferase subunit A